jgi:GT2 family glycosyltransferase
MEGRNEGCGVTQTPENGGPLIGVGLVIVHYRNEKALAATLGCLEHEGLLALPTVVVDNGGAVGPMGQIRQRHRGIRWLTLDNPGYGAAVNAGIRAHPADVSMVCVLTHEVLLRRSVVERMVEALAVSPMTIVGPKLVDGRTGGVWSLGGRQSRWTGKPAHVRHERRAVDMPYPGLEAEWLDGAVFAIRRADFEKIGGINEDFFLYFEDVELGWRLRRLFGGRVLVLPQVSAEQSPGGALDQYLATRNMLYLLWIQRRWGALALFMLETMLRLTVGAMVKPVGARDRGRRRMAGLTAAARLIRKGPST